MKPVWQQIAAQRLAALKRESAKKVAHEHPTAVTALKAAAKTIGPNIIQLS